MYIHTFLFKMTDTMTSQNVDLSSWNTLYSVERCKDDERLMVTEGDGHGLLEGTIPLFAETD
jgi:hypothetical protein